MTNVWQLQEAKNKLSEVIEAALSQGPQIITRRGVETAVVLSFAEYRRTVASKQKLSTFFRESPLAQVELDLSRDQSAPRPDVVL